MRKHIVTTLMIVWYLLPAGTTFAFTHADSLRGGNGRGRDWWSVYHYDLTLNVDTATESISGVSIIDLRITKTPGDSLQVDLQEPMVIDSVFQRYERTNIRQPVGFVREGNVYWITLKESPFRYWRPTELRSFKIYFHGRPRKATRPPWEGGMTWTHDTSGKQWVGVSCQGVGASTWWPCKDAQWDEPEKGINIHIQPVGNYSIVSNGRFVQPTPRDEVTTPFWQVKNPINSYDVTFYIGDYVHWHDTLMGEKGKLDLDYWVLRNNEEKARKQFAQVKPLIHCYEYWLGPYPFYEDGYKMVESPYVGMEHQSAIAYGNKYRNGYSGDDRSHTGIGLGFDYIIVHESGHEWFGNSVTAKDIADNWIHEGITTYSESLFAECLLGKDKGQEYCRGEWQNILNDKPMTGHYGVNEEGSGDIYDKGVAIMHMIRTMTNDDERFRLMLRSLSRTFYHKTVTTQDVEIDIAKHTGLDLKAFFDQYLRTTDIPELEYYVKDKQLFYKFNKTVAGFTLPIVAESRKQTVTIKPTAEWQSVEWKGKYNVKFSKDFLVKVKG